MDPFTISSAASLGMSAFESLFRQPNVPDVDAQNRAIAEENRALIEQRMREIRNLFNRRGEFFGEQMDILNPQLAFAGTQGRQAANAGARASQASLRRSLGSGGDIFASALETGARTVAADRQNTLRALATSEAFEAADRRISSEAGLLSSMPIGFVPPATGSQFAGQMAQSNQRSSLFANVGTGFGALAANRKSSQGSAFMPYGPTRAGWNPYDVTSQPSIFN